MSPTFESRYLLLLAVAVALVGTVGAILDGDWDLLAVLGMLVVLLLVLGSRSFGRRPAVPIRVDLAAWLRQRAATTGETLETVADRAVASYRDRLDRDPGQRDLPRRGGA